MENFDLNSLGTFINVGAWVVIAYAFMNGKVYSNVAVDKMLELSKDMTNKLATEVKDGMESSVQKGVKLGVIEAFQEMNGKSTKN